MAWPSRLGIAGRHGEPGHPVDDDLGGPVDRRGDDRAAGREGLHGDQGQALEVRGQHGELRRGVPVRDVGAVADEVDAVEQAELARSALEALPEAALSHDDGVKPGRLAADRRQRRQQDLVALLGREPPHDQQHGVLRPEAERRLQRGRRIARTVEAAEVAAVRDDDDLPRRQTLLLEEVAGVRVGDGDVVVDAPPGQRGRPRRRPSSRGATAR